STLHTTDAAESINRIVEFFPPQKHQQIKSILAGVLRGAISPRVLPRIDRGRVAAVEVMINNARIADLIRENRTGEIEEAIADGEFFKMQTFTQALTALVLGGEVDREVAANAAGNKLDFLVALDRAVKERAEEERKAAEEEASGHPSGLRPAASPGRLRMVQRADA